LPYSRKNFKQIYKANFTVVNSERPQLLSGHYLGKLHQM
jgi:hypothetical protein